MQEVFHAPLVGQVFLKTVQERSHETTDTTPYNRECIDIKVVFSNVQYASTNSSMFLWSLPYAHSTIIMEQTEEGLTCKQNLVPLVPYPMFVPSAKAHTGHAVRPGLGQSKGRGSR